MWFILSAIGLWSNLLWKNEKMETDGNRKTDILFVISPYHKRNGSGSIFPLGISSIIAYLEANEKI